MAKEELALYRARLGEAGVSLLPSLPRAAGEGDALYFHDPDGIYVNCMTAARRNG